MEKKKIWHWLVPALAVYAVGFALAARFDLAINQAIYTPSHLVSVFMEAYGWWPVYLPVLVFSILVVARPREQRVMWQLAAGCAVALAGLVVLSAVSFSNVVDEQHATGVADPRAIGWLAIGVLVGAGLVWMAWHAKPETRRILEWMALWGIVMMALNQSIVTVWKEIWSRTRFDDMVNAGMLDFAHFTPWYRPFGYGGTSFPSGHTANATCVLTLTFLCDILPGWKKRRVPVYVLCWLYIAFMAFTRIWIGRHYLSDTLAGSGIMALLYFAVKRTPWYQNSLRRRQEKRNLLDGI